MNKTAVADASAATNEGPETSGGQPARASNIDAIVAYFESGITPAGTAGELGIELEHTLVHDDMSPVAYSGPYGVEWLLGQLEAEFPRTTRDPEGDLLGVARPGEAVTIEPAAQVELSAGPFASLEDARATFERFERTLDDVLAPHSERALTVGYHPSAKALDLELIPKRRYKFMNLYLGEKGPFGPRMMRGSASTQVSIDYWSTADCLRKLRLAFALVPLFSLVCDNAPVFEGAPRTHELVRTEIWRYCDPDRCGLVPGVMDPGFDLRRYAEYLLDTPAILIPCRKEQWCYSERTFGEIYAERTMTRAEVEHAVSMFFNDVRLKTYIEIRPADAMPVPYVVAYAVLPRGEPRCARRVVRRRGRRGRGGGQGCAHGRRIRGRGVRKARGRAGRRGDDVGAAGPRGGRAGLPGTARTAGSTARHAGRPGRGQGLNRRPHP